MSTPVWLLDVDGVINAARPGWHTAPHHDVIHADGNEWKMRWSPHVTDYIRETAQHHTVELRWASTWNPHTEELNRIFQLPDVPAAFGPQPTHHSYIDAKLHAALTVVEVEHRPLIWTDDNTIPPPGTASRARLLNAGPPVLLISPLEHTGLQPEHITLIRDFLAQTVT